MNLNLTRISSLEESLFQSADQLLKASFIPEEYREYTPELMLNPVFFMHAVFSGERFVGVITSWEFPDFVFLEHLVTDPELRGQNIGARVIQALLALRPSKRHIGEIQRPETDIATRRMGFFKRLGFQINPYDYIQPPYSAAKSPVPMLMISHPELLSSDLYEHIKGTVYRDVYGLSSSMKF